MVDLISVIISGLANGSAYALFALGVVIIFRSTDTVNFAIGDTGTFSVFVALYIINIGAPVYVAFLSAIVVAGIIGVATERLIIRPLGHGHHVLFVALVITIGLGLVLQASIGALWGHEARSFPPLISGWVNVFNIPISWNKIAASVAALVAMGIVAWFFGYMPFGIAMRASAEDPVAARVLGLKIGRISIIAWFLGCALASIAMLFLAGETSLNPYVANAPLFRAFAGVFIGGMTSMPGAVLGGFLIGILDNVVGAYISANYRDTIVFAVIVAVLFIRPSGFLGSIRKERV